MISSFEITLTVSTSCLIAASSHSTISDDAFSKALFVDIILYEKSAFSFLCSSILAFLALRSVISTASGVGSGSIYLTAFDVFHTDHCAGQVITGV